MGSFIKGKENGRKKPAGKDKKPVCRLGETAEQDIHQTIEIGMAAIVAHAAQADSMMDDILAFVENSTEAEIVSVEREIR